VRDGALPNLSCAAAQPIVQTDAGDRCTAGFQSCLCPLWVIRVEVGQTCLLFMSAVPPKADISSTCWGGRYHRRLQRGLRHLKIRAESHRSARIISDVDPFRDGKCVVDLDTEVPHRTLDLDVAEQELYRAQVARPAID